MAAVGATLESSMGVGRTESLPLSRPETQRDAMTSTMAVRASSRLASWLSSESPLDRYASYGAFALGLAAMTLMLVL